MSLPRKLPVVAGLLIIAGCTTTTVETYQRVPSARAEQAYLKPGVSFKRYKQLYPLRLEIYYAKGAGAPTQEDLERIRTIFRTAFLKELGGDYRITSQPAPDALAVRASLVDLQSGTADDLQLGGKLSGLVASGQLTFFMELSDSMTGEVLARAADPDKPVADPSSAAGSSSLAWARVETAAAHWAAEFRSFLDEYLGS